MGDTPEPSPYIDTVCVVAIIKYEVTGLLLHLRGSVMTANKETRRATPTWTLLRIG